MAVVVRFVIRWRYVAYGALLAAVGFDVRDWQFWTLLFTSMAMESAAKWEAAKPRVVKTMKVRDANGVMRKVRFVK